jgi:hypothetical protein
VIVARKTTGSLVAARVASAYAARTGRRPTILPT